jgi:hypothetical protein
MEPSQEDFAEVLKPLRDITERHRELGQRGPSPKSEAYRDGRNKLGRIAWDFALHTSVIGVEHLTVWQLLRLKVGLQPNFGHFTLLRAAIEGAAVTRWLCDPSISTSERVRRAVGVRLADYEERLKYERRMGPRLPKPTGKGRTAQQRIDAFAKLLKLRQIEPITMPRATELFARYASIGDPINLSGESFFRQMAGVIHAKEWSVFGMSDLGEMQLLPNGRRVLRLRADHKLAFVLTSIAMDIALDALGDLESYGSPAVRVAKM